MIEKDLNIEETYADDFDSLLDDFVKSNLNDDSEKSENIFLDKWHESLDLPKVIKAELMTDDNSAVVFSNEILTLVLECDKSVKTATEFSLSCYNGDYFKMCEMTENIKARRRKFDISFVSSHKWLPGEYVVYGEMNGVPMCKITFQITERSVEITGIERLTAMSEGYHFMRNLDKGDAGWAYFQKVSCVGKIRKKIVSYISTYGIMDILRKERGMNQIHRNCNYIIRGSYSEDWISNVELFIGYFKSSGSYMYMDCVELTSPSCSNDFIDPIKEAFPKGNDSIVVFSGLQGLFSAKGNCLVQNMVKFLKKSRERSVALCGSKREIEQVLETFPILRDYFPKDNVLDVGPMKAYEIIYKIQSLLSKQDLLISSQIYRRLAQSIISAVEEGRLSDWNENSVVEYVNNHIVANFCTRVFNQIKSAEGIPSDVNELIMNDVNFDVFSPSEDTFDKCIEDLNEMVGLEKLKKEIATTFNYVRFNTVRRNLGLKADIGTSHHMIFTGNPGTGKTTVAKKIGKIYHSLGLLSKGEVIVTERSKMVGRYIGETEQNMLALLEEARGNVLFVDEAYTLCDLSDDRKDYGHHALESLLTVLSQKNPDMLIIFAGYENEINRMLQVNQGLAGRFPYHFHFDDYSADELMQIACVLLENADYVLSEEAAKMLRSTIEESVKHKDENFSNARWITQYVTNGIIPAMGQRVLAGGVRLTREVCQTVEVADVKRAYEKYRLDSSLKSEYTLPKVGFRVA